MAVPNFPGGQKVVNIFFFLMKLCKFYGLVGVVHDLDFNYFYYNNTIYDQDYLKKFCFIQLIKKSVLRKQKLFLSKTLGL